MIMQPKYSRMDRLVVLTEQPTIPTGMIDSFRAFSGAVANEILEETGFEFLLS